MGTRGIRNNNPLNIRHSADKWEGARINQTDPSFVQFTSMAYGYRAAWKLLDSYWKHFKNIRKPYTVSNIVHRWAPPTENNTEAYAKTVIRLTSLGGMENLPRPFVGISIDKLVRLLRAMTTVECGIPYNQVSEAEIWEGYRLAFPGKLKKCQRNAVYNGTTGMEPFRIELTDEDKYKYPAYDEYWDWSAAVV